MPTRNIVPSREYFASLAGPGSIELGTHDFTTNNFFNLTREQQQRGGYTPTEKLMAATPPATLFAQIIKTALPHDIPFEPAQRYIEAKQAPLYEAFAKRHTQAEIDAKIRATIPTNAAIVGILDVAQEFIESKYFAQYEFLVEESRRLGLFVVSNSLEEPRNTLPQAG